MYKVLNKVCKPTFDYKSFGTFQCHAFCSLATSHIDLGVYTVLNPYVDFHERLSSVCLRESIQNRKLKIDLDNLTGLWTQYKKQEDKRYKLERSKEGVVETIKQYSDDKKYQKEIEGLKIKGKIVRKDLKNVISICSELQSRLLPTILALPNDIDNELYSREEELIIEPNEGSIQIHHLEIGKKLNVLDFISAYGYFLIEEGADFELNVMTAFHDIFMRNNFIPFSNPDFSRTLLTEGCSINEKSLLKLVNDSAINPNDNFYLNGTASLLPFVSYHSKHITEALPVRYVSQGRAYNLPSKSSEDGLYSVAQNSAVQVFIGCSSSDVKSEFNKTVDIISEMYKLFEIPFRIVRAPPVDLQLSEALRLSFQVHSPYKKDFVEVGNLSYYSDYLSKRLRIYYKEEDSKHFMQLISGTIIKVPVLLAASLENKYSCEIPKKLFK